MTEYRRCDDCQKWTDVETMDRFLDYKHQTVCKPCSAKRRGIVDRLMDDNCGNAEDKCVDDNFIFGPDGEG